MSSDAKKANKALLDSLWNNWLKEVTKERGLEPNALKESFLTQKKDLTYLGYFISYKVLPNEISAKRSISIKRNKNIVSCSSPKIANIFEFENYIKKLIKLK